jgi:hypothetical protein
MDAQMLKTPVGLPRPFARCQRPVPIVAVPQVAASLGSQLPRRRPVFSSRSHTVVRPRPVVWAVPAEPLETEKKQDYGYWGYATYEEIRRMYSWGGNGPVGKGSYGEVYPCVSRETGENFAVKWVLCSRDSRTSSFPTMASHGIALTAYTDAIMTVAGS